jgi:PAT family beta-lactamase induction signal transducer AmpG
MGFSSGLPLLLVGGTLKGWLAEKGIDLKTIGFFSVVGMPYAWKFVWSPLMDRFVPPLGRRRGWLAFSQLGVMASLILLSFVDPQKNISLMAVCALLVAFFSASQDIVVDAYRREILPDEELGLGSSLYVFGYRLAMLASNAGAFILADHISWTATYWIMAAFMFVGLATTYFAPEPDVEAPPPRSLKESVIGPLLEFFRRDSAWLILAFVVLYKIGESMASDMFNPLYIQLGFTKTQIGGIAKGVGFWALIVGGIAGGTLIVRFGIYHCLWAFGILQSLGLLLFSVLSEAGQSLVWLGVSVGTENLFSGMATSAYVAFMASQTNKRFTATQYALLSSLMGVPRIFFGASTGILAEHLGWTMYFVACSVFTIPGLLLLIPLRRFLR